MQDADITQKAQSQAGVFAEQDIMYQQFLPSPFLISGKGDKQKNKYRSNDKSRLVGVDFQLTTQNARVYSNNPNRYYNHYI